MGAYKRRKNANKLPPFVALTWEMLNSSALTDLNHYSRAALPYFLGKVKLPYKHSERFTMGFKFPYSEGKKLGFPTSTFSKAICQLIAHGFIDPIERGGCYGDLKLSNKFALSRRWEKYGTKNFITVDWNTFIQEQRKARTK